MDCLSELQHLYEHDWEYARINNIVKLEPICGDNCLELDAKLKDFKISAHNLNNLTILNSMYTSIVYQNRIYLFETLIDTFNKIMNTVKKSQNNYLIFLAKSHEGKLKEAKTHHKLYLDNERSLKNLLYVHRSTTLDIADILMHLFKEVLKSKDIYVSDAKNEIFHNLVKYKIMTKSEIHLAKNYFNYRNLFSHQQGHIICKSLFNEGDFKSELPKLFSQLEGMLINMLTSNHKYLLNVVYEQFKNMPLDDTSTFMDSLSEDNKKAVIKVFNDKYNANIKI